MHNIISSKYVKPKGFTLIELLIVIAILAILSTVTVLVLNPAELLRQARDAQRVSDLAALHGALSLYLLMVSSSDLDAISNRCLNESPPGTASCFTDQQFFAPSPLPNGCGVSGTSPLVPVYSVNKSINGTGWLPVNFTLVPGGSPLITLPRDPTSGLNNYYTFICNQGNRTYELNAWLESVKYGPTKENLAGKDGGSSVFIYEVGTDPGLDL